MTEDGERAVFFISDHTGITAEVVGHSLLARFEGERFRFVTRPFVDSVDEAERVVAEIDREAQGASVRPIAFVTLTDAAIAQRLMTARALLLDIFNPHLAALEGELESAPSPAVGRYHRIVDLSAYQTRMDAVDYALSTDDGLATQSYQRADIILLGVSRAGKTPTCLFLGMQFGIRAANYPLADDDFDSLALPRAVADHRDKLFGLTIDPLRLHQIRRRRKPDSRYASLDQCESEVRQGERLYERQGIGYLNTTVSSVEEIAATIMQRAGIQRRLH